VEAGYGVALDLPFNLPSATELAGLRARGQGLREDALEERAGRIFSYLNETTLNEVFTTIERGLDQNLTVQQIAESLRERFSNVEEIGKRAMMIARTEVLTAVSLGQAAAMKDAASLIPNLKKMWVTASDDRVRGPSSRYGYKAGGPNHEDLHGDIVAHDSPFENGLQFPRDPSGPPGEVIQCRCSWIMLPEEQMSAVSPSGLETDEEPS
jgi:uncharacterized protein with gpF-like domain